MTSELLSPLAGYLIVFLSLLAFVFVTLVWTGFNVQTLLYPKEDFLSARGVTSWITLGLSLYISAVGNWVLYMPALMGVLGGWVAAIVFSITCAFAIEVVAILGSATRNLMPHLSGFTSTDYFRERFGLVPQLFVGILSLLILTLNLSSELTCVANCIGLLTGDTVSVVVVILGMGLVTLAYTLYAGLPASICTDKVQAVIVLICLVVITPVAFNNVKVPADGWSQLPKWTDSKAWLLSINTLISMLTVESMNQGSWQRVFAANSNKVLHKSYAFATILCFPTVLVFAISGVVARASFPHKYDDLVFSNTAFFQLLQGVSPAFLGVMGVFGVSLAASSMDTLQCAMGALIGSELKSREYSMNWARLATVILNIPAIIIAVNQIDVYKLYMLSNALILSAASPTILSLWVHTTYWGFLLGCVVGIGSMFIYGWIATLSFVGGMSFPFPDSTDTVEYLGMLLTIIISSTVICVGVSLVELRLRPFLAKEEKERRNLIKSKLSTTARCKLSYYMEDDPSSENGEASKQCDVPIKSTDNRTEHVNKKESESPPVVTLVVGG